MPYSIDSNPAIPDDAQMARAVAPVDPSLGSVLWRRKALIIGFLLAGLVGGYVLFTQQEESYQANATIQVYRQQMQSGMGAAVEDVIDMAPGLPFIEAEMTSDGVLLSAIEKGRLTSFPGMPSSPAAAVMAIRESLELLPPIEGGESLDRTVVQVAFTSSNPGLATEVVNAVVQAYEEYINSRHLGAIDDVVGFFKEGRDSTLPKLEKLEEEYSKFRTEAPLEWSADGDAINPYREETIRLEDKLLDFRTDERQLESKLRLLHETASGGKTASEVLRDVQFVLDDIGELIAATEAIGGPQGQDASIEARLMTLRVRAEIARGEYAASHPVRQQIENELQITEAEMRKLEEDSSSTRITSDQIEKKREEVAASLLRRFESGLRKKLQMLQDDIADFDARAKSVRDKALDLVKAENQNQAFLRRIARYQELLDSFDSQLAKASLPNLNAGLEVQVLRPAGMGVLVGPLLSRDLVLGGFLGAVLGGLLGLFFDWSERTFRSPDEIASTLNLPILSHLPVIIGRKRTPKRNEDGEDVYRDIDPIITVLREPHAPASEAIRSIRTALLSSNAKGSHQQVIQFTSSLPGEGKSTICGNLGASIAGANLRVIIVDADLRRPSQGKLFGISGGKGLTDVLNGECGVEEAIVQTAVEGLYMMPTGRLPNNPSEALMLPDFGQVLEDLRSSFDFVLVDTPPLLAVTDASNVAAHVDGVMMVIRIARRVKPLAKRTVTILRSLNVNVIGLVVNAVGDSGYSATYASAWSDVYGGQPGAEYIYGYRRYGKDRYLNASKEKAVTVRGKAVRAEPVSVATKEEDLTLEE